MADAQSYNRRFLRKVFRPIWKARHYFLSSARMKKLLGNAWLDLRYGGSFLGGSVVTRFAHLGAHDTGNTDYSILPLVFANRVKASDVLVDVGCGRGRVIVWWLSQGYRNSMIGLELDPDIAQVCARRMKRHKNVKIIAGNAVDSIPKEGTLFYLFDPFELNVVGQFKEKLEGMFCARDDIRIVFLMTKSLGAFESSPNWRVEEVSVPFPPPFRSAVLTLIKPELCERCRS